MCPHISRMIFKIFLLNLSLTSRGFRLLTLISSSILRRTQTRFSEISARNLIPFLSFTRLFFLLLLCALVAQCQCFPWEKEEEERHDEKKGLFSALSTSRRLHTLAQKTNREEKQSRTIARAEGKRGENDSRNFVPFVGERKGYCVIIRNKLRCSFFDLRMSSIFFEKKREIIFT